MAIGPDGRPQQSGDRGAGCDIVQGPSPMPNSLNSQRLAALAVTLLAAATIAVAWGFELIGGYIPCALCLKERIPYYVGIPVAVLALIAASRPAPSWLPRALLLASALVFAYGSYLGVYHAGTEWGFWLGPADCGVGGGSATTSANDILSQIDSVRIVSCTEATWRFPAGWGLSFAGWNAAISILLVIVALWGAMQKPRS
jgi:disulfide bond formation protein DsbB